MQQLNKRIKIMNHKKLLQVAKILTIIAQQGKMNNKFTKIKDCKWVEPIWENRKVVAGYQIRMSKVILVEQRE